MLRTIIIEDELNAQFLLSNLLSTYCPNVKLVDTQQRIEESIQSINYNKPDLVFLDYQLLDGTASDILEQLDYRSFKIIFTTAHKEFALEAFKYEAMDYILKPYGPSDVIKAVARVEEHKKVSELYSDFKNLIDRSKIDAKRKISIHNQKEITRIELDDIVRVEADGSYSTFYLSGGNKNMVSKSLKEIELQLDFPNFFRCHTSHLINLDHVQSYRNEDGGSILLSDKKCVPLARRRKSEFLNLIT